jgi:hypothetical protein
MTRTLSTIEQQIKALKLEADLLRVTERKAEIKSLCDEAQRLDRAAKAINNPNGLAELVRIINRVDEIAKRLVALRFEAERAVKRMMRAGVRP